MRISVDGSRIRNNKVAFSNLSGIVWTGPNSLISAFVLSTMRECCKTLSVKIFLI